ncbi:MAG: hypothetical protein RLY58_1985 [Pseudomonadota bacterium]
MYLPRPQHYLTLMVMAALTGCGGSSDGGTTTDALVTTTPTITPPAVTATGTTTFSPFGGSVVLQPDTDGFSVTHHQVDPVTTAYTFFQRQNGQRAAGDAIVVHFNELTQQVQRVMYVDQGLDSATVYSCQSCSNVVLQRGISLQDQMTVAFNQQKLDTIEILSNTAPSALDRFSDQQWVSNIVQLNTPTVLAPQNALIKIGQTPNILEGTLTGKSIVIPADASALPKAWSGSILANGVVVQPLYSLTNGYGGLLYIQGTNQHGLYGYTSLVDQQLKLDLVKTDTTTNPNTITSGTCTIGMGQFCAVNVANDRSLSLAFNQAVFLDQSNLSVFGNVTGTLQRRPQGYQVASVAAENPVVAGFNLMMSWTGLSDGSTSYSFAGQRQDDADELKKTFKPSVRWTVLTKNNQVTEATLRVFDEQKNTWSVYACDQRTTTNPCSGITVQAATGIVTLNQQRLRLTQDSPVDEHTYVTPEQSITIRQATLTNAGY